MYTSVDYPTLLLLSIITISVVHSPTNQLPRSVLQPWPDFHRSSLNVITNCYKEGPIPSYPLINKHDSGFRRISYLTTARACSRLTQCHLRQLQELRNNQMRKTRSYPHGYRLGFTNHRMIPHSGLHMPQPRVTTLFIRS